VCCEKVKKGTLLGGDSSRGRPHHAQSGRRQLHRRSPSADLRARGLERARQGLLQHQQQAVISGERPPSQPQLGGRFVAITIHPSPGPAVRARFVDKSRGPTLRTTHDRLFVEICSRRQRRRLDGDRHR
ncbi:hypothetical protein THAOC_26172, partial [Thalassiosira oceanica]